MERLLLRRLHLQELPQTLLTFGFLFIFSDLAIFYLGQNPQTMPKPPCSASRFSLATSSILPYRLFIIAFGLLVAALLWWLQEGTRLGSMLRARVDDEETARALGINVSVLFTLVFALGAFLAAPTWVEPWADLSWESIPAPISR